MSRRREGTPNYLGLGEATVLTADGPAKVTQGTDEYLWAKLLTDEKLMAENPELAEIVANRDRSRIEYPLIKTDTRGNVTEYEFNIELGPKHPDYMPKANAAGARRGALDEVSASSMTSSMNEAVATASLAVERLSSSIPIGIGRIVETVVRGRRNLDQSMAVFISRRQPDRDERWSRIVRGFTFAAQMR